MLTRAEEGSDSEVAGSSDERIKAAKQRHSEVVQQTRQMMISWILLITINFITHFMRISVVILYCIQRFGVSEFQVGLLVTIHMLVMSAANSYLCYMADSYPFEPLATSRFCILTLATLGEYFADSFWLFALVYCSASLSVVWFGVQNSYLVRMLPPVQAKELSTKVQLLNRAGILIGVSLGGLVGGLLSMRGVFLLSFAFAGFSLFWMLFVLRGTEQRIKEMQVFEIAHMYREMPEVFNDKNDMFPVPFASQMIGVEMTATITQTIHNDSSHMTKKEEGYDMEYDDHHNENDDDDTEPSETQAMLSTRIENDSIAKELQLLSAEAIPFWTIALRNSLTAALLSEFVSWWNVYAHQVFHANISRSSSQCVISTVFSVIVGVGCLVIVKHQQFEYGNLLKYGTLVCTLSGLTIALMFLAVFPFLTFVDFWWALMIETGLFGLTTGFPNNLVICESPPKQAGRMFAVSVALMSAVPALQHVVIGALWNAGGHAWVFRWFGMMHLICVLLMLFYYSMRVSNPPTRAAIHAIHN